MAELFFYFILITVIYIFVEKFLIILLWNYDGTKNFHGDQEDLERFEREYFTNSFHKFIFYTIYIIFFLQFIFGTVNGLHLRLYNCNFLLFFNLSPLICPPILNW